MEHRPISSSLGSLLCPRRLGFGIGRRSREAEPPPEVGRDVEPGPVEPGAVPHAARGPEVLRSRVGHSRHHRPERRWAFDGGEPLHRAGVAQTEGADPPVRPRLPRGPFDGVVAVAALLEVRLEGAAGLVSSPYVLQDHRVPPSDGGLYQRRGVRQLVPAVRGAVHQDRKTPPLEGPDDIGAKDDAVAQRNRDGGIDSEGSLCLERRDAQGDRSQLQEGGPSERHVGKATASPAPHLCHSVLHQVTPLRSAAYRVRPLAAPAPCVRGTISATLASPRHPR